MRVLVTGATGFVGRHLVAELQSHPGIEPVAGVRRGDQATSPNSLVMGSIGIDPPPSLLGIDAVIHCAARVHVMQDAAADPLTEFRRLNVDGTAALAERAANDGVRRFIFLSSVKVNGEKTGPGRPFRVSDAPAPVDPYGVSKAEAELALTDLARRTGLELVIIRPTLVYGPGVKGNFISLLRLLKKGLPLPLGGIDNRRSMVSHTNLATLIATCVSHADAPGKVFFAADAEAISTTLLLRKLGTYLGRPPALFPVPSSMLALAAGIIGRSAQYDRLFGSLEVDIAPNLDVLGWRPSQSADDGLRQTAAWFNDQQ